MHILITGTSGYIGNHLLKMIRREFMGALISVADPKDGGVDYRTLKGHDFDLVFHLGAISTIMDSFARADEMMDINALGLIPFFQNNGVGKFIFSSTGAIYGNMEHPMKEYEARWMDCLAPYAQTKYVAEGIINRMCPNHMIARFGNVFGGNYLPRTEWLAPRHFMEDNPIVIHGGTQIRDFIHVNTVCKALIKSAIRSDVVGTFNIANGQGEHLKDIAKMFADERGVELIFKPLRGGDAEYVVLNVDKARAAGLIPQQPEVNDYHS